MPRLRRHANPGCKKKHKHGTRQAAERHMNSLIDGGAYEDSLNVYRCAGCGTFHVGHRPGYRRT